MTAQTSTIRQRLRQELERLGMNQTDFAELGGKATRAAHVDGFYGPTSCKS